MKNLAKVVVRLEWAIDCLILFGIVVVAVIQVMSRYLGSRVGSPSFWWTEEIARLLLVWFTFWSASILTRYGQHIRFDSLINKLGRRGRTVADLFAELVSIAFFGMVLWAGLTAAPNVIKIVTMSLQWSEMTFFAAILFGTALMFIYSIARFVLSIRALKASQTG